MEEITAPVESVAVETAPIETSPATQVVEKPQETTNSQVETVVNKPQVQDPQRNRPSNYYRERERIRKLESEIASIREEQARFKQSSETSKPKPEGTKPLTVDELLANPDGVFKSRDERLMQEFNNLRQEISMLKDQKVNQEKDKNEREALEMLFPKSSPDADEPLEQRIENEERKEALEKLFRENPGLDRLMRIAPKEAAELALLKLQPPKPLTSPKVIDKKLMGGTARGNPGQSRIVTLEDKMSELKKLKEEMNQKTELRFNPEHKSKRDSLMREIDGMLAKERGNNK